MAILGRPFTIATVDIGYSESVRHRPKMDGLFSGAIKVKGVEFSDYVKRVLVRDGIGFVPTKDLWSGVAYDSHIQAIVPKSSHEFLVYCHEMGHLKSKQYHRSSQSSMFSYSCPATIKNELNAWLWGLRYYRRLGFVLCDKGKELVKEAFGSYLKSADQDVAMQARDKLFAKFGIKCQIIDHPRPTITSFYCSFDSTKFWIDKWVPNGPKTPKKLPVVKEKPKHWKPWHDMKDKQIKKTWRNMR